MNKTEYIFITGFGRSGTTFLSHLLSVCNEVQSYHEYIGNREFELLSWYLGKTYSKPYLENQKMKIEQKKKNDLKFLDVNGAYRNCINELDEVFKPTKIFHLVRDPKDVIRSLFTRRDDRKVHFVPKNEDDIKWWLNADKFGQICWNWNTETKALLKKDLDILYFEKIIGDYDYFKNELLEKVGLSMEFNTWKSIVSVKKNKTKPKLYRYLYAKLKSKQFIEERLPKYENWSNDQKKVFNDICGDTMLKLGYE